MKACEPHLSRLFDRTNRNTSQVATTLGRYDWIIRLTSRSIALPRPIG